MQTKSWKPTNDDRAPAILLIKLMDDIYWGVKSVSSSNLSGWPFRTFVLEEGMGF